VLIPVAYPWWYNTRSPCSSWTTQGDRPNCGIAGGTEFKMQFEKVWLWSSGEVENWIKTNAGKCMVKKIEVMIGGGRNNGIVSW
jgi:hypothetical protein